MVVRSQKVYLSSADLQMESYLEPDSFERSLLVNMLFQPGILVPDIFFFISTGIARHLRPGLRPGPRTLLEAALEAGEITPAFRDQNISGFVDALRVVRGAGDERKAIIGIRDDAEETARRLDMALSANSAPQYWPKWDISRCFQQRIEELLSNGSAPRLPVDSGVPQARIEELWEYTEPWRTDCVQRAVLETAQVGGTGLRRGLLMTAVGRAVGVVSGDGKLNSVAELLEASLPSEDLNALHYFCRWITDIYQYNQACEFGAIPNFPEYEPLTGVFANEILEREAGHSDVNSERFGLSIQAPMPSLATLSQVSPDDILSIKKNVGIGYFAALQAWQADDNPSAALEQEVQRTLTEYGNALVREVNRRGATGVGVIEAVLSRSKRIGDSILPSTLAYVVGAAASQLPPTLVALAAVGTGLFAVYRWWRRRPEEVEVKLRGSTSILKRPRNLDVNIVQGTHSLGHRSV